jgi:DNA-binding Lrp family transcriptional regulator
MTAVKEKLDELDLRIVDLLSEDPRRPVKNIAEEIGVTRLTVSRRLNKLVKSGLIA